MNSLLSPAEHVLKLKLRITTTQQQIEKQQLQLRQSRPGQFLPLEPFYQMCEALADEMDMLQKHGHSIASLETPYMELLVQLSQLQAQNQIFQSAGKACLAILTTKSSA